MCGNFMMRCWKKERVPLDLLEAHVNEWMKTQSAAKIN